jgi:hypothetical protein
MASLDDILTTQKNGVVAINNLGQYFSQIAGYLQQIEINTNLATPATVSPAVQASTTQLIVAGSGRLFAVAITAHAGSNKVYIYNSATVGGVSTSNRIYASDAANAAAFRNYDNVSLAYTDGIVIECEASMNCCVSYTPNP